MKNLKSNEEIVRLLENLWLRHKAGLPQRKDNAFWIEMPPDSCEDKEE